MPPGLGSDSEQPLLRSVQQESERLHREHKARKGGDGGAESPMLIMNRASSTSVTDMEMLGQRNRWLDGHSELPARTAVFDGDDIFTRPPESSEEDAAEEEGTTVGEAQRAALRALGGSPNGSCHNSRRSSEPQLLTTLGSGRESGFSVSSPVNSTTTHSGAAPISTSFSASSLCEAALSGRNSRATSGAAMQDGRAAGGGADSAAGAGGAAGLSTPPRRVDPTALEFLTNPAMLMGTPESTVGGPREASPGVVAPTVRPKPLPATQRLRRWLYGMGSTSSSDASPSVGSAAPSGTSSDTQPTDAVLSSARGATAHRQPVPNGGMSASLPASPRPHHIAATERRLLERDGSGCGTHVTSASHAAGAPPRWDAGREEGWGSSSLAEQLARFGQRAETLRGERRPTTLRLERTYAQLCAALQSIRVERAQLTEGSSGSDLAAGGATAAEVEMMERLERREAALVRQCDRLSDRLDRARGEAMGLKDRRARGERLNALMQRCRCVYQDTQIVMHAPQPALQ